MMIPKKGTLILISDKLSTINTKLSLLNNILQATKIPPKAFGAPKFI